FSHLGWGAAKPNLAILAPELPFFSGICAAPVRWDQFRAFGCTRACAYWRESGNGTSVAFDEADVIYVNAGCTKPVESWLDRLADGGRLILPLTSDQDFGGGSPERMASAGAVFRVERRGEDYLAKWISPVAIFPCVGSRDEASERLLADAFAKGGWERVTRLYRNQSIADENCWLRGPGWALAYS